MRYVIRENKLYFTYLASFVVLGGIVLAAWGKPDAILFFSKNRTAWADIFFRLTTHLGEGVAYLLAAIVFFKRRQYVWSIAAAGLIVLISSYCLKELFAVDRPLTFFRNTGLADQINFVEGVDLYTGATSFPSGHAMGAFALYTLLALLLPKHPAYPTILFLLGITVVVSRIYLVQHFWQDVYAGTMLGSLIGVSVFAIQQRLELKPPSTA